MDIPSKLYVCISDNNKLSIHTREDIDDVIEKAETDNSGKLDFTSIGSISAQDITEKHFAVSFVQTNKVNHSVLYDVIKASSPEQAQAIIENKDRFRNKNLSFKRIVDLTELINEEIG